MNFVQPIRDPEQIQQIKEYLKEKSERLVCNGNQYRFTYK